MNLYSISPKTSLHKSTRVQSTDDQNSESDQVVQKPTQNKYKTELCKNYSENGYCPYYEKCQFAHGQHQLCHTSKKLTSGYRSAKCKPYWQCCNCRYGQRCQFSHTTKTKSYQLNQLKALLEVLSDNDSHLAQKTQKKSRLISLSSSYLN